MISVMNGDEVRTIDLERAVGASRQTLLATAHELKAPLSLIRMYAAAMQEADLSEAEQKRYMQRISLTAEHLLQLTQGMVEGYRWEKGQLPLEPVNTQAVCEEVLHSLTPYARELDQQLQYRPTRRAHLAVAHRLFLKNVLFNVVFNALKHTPARTIVGLSQRQLGSALQLAVLDTGPGFQKSTLRQINDNVGRRLQAVESHSGSGLGLAVARQLTEAMGGELRLTASSKGGFCALMLPLSRQLSFLP